MRQLICDVCGNPIALDGVTYRNYPCTDGRVMDITFTTALSTGLYSVPCDVCLKCQHKMLDKLLSPRDPE